MNIIEQLEAEQIAKLTEGKTIPNFAPGDTLRVNVKINSAFRGPSVNAAVGGSKTSQHMKGEAADIVATAVSVEELHRWICAESGLAFGQCILEKSSPSKPFSWVHVSLGTKREALVYDGAGKYTPWRPK